MKKIIYPILVLTLSACGDGSVKNKRSVQDVKDSSISSNDELKASNFPKYLVAIVDAKGNVTTKVSNEDYSSLSDQDIARAEVESIKKDNVALKFQSDKGSDDAAAINGESDSFFFGSASWGNPWGGGFLYASFGPGWCGLGCGNGWFGGFHSYYNVGYRYSHGYSWGGYNVYRYGRDCGEMCMPGPVQPMIPGQPVAQGQPVVPMAPTQPMAAPVAQVQPMMPSAYMQPGMGMPNQQAQPVVPGQPQAPVAGGTVVNQPQGLCAPGAICPAGGQPNYY
ncbi:MAG: hypothetical protein HQK54_18540 [Oligoflexales bacterium]|nr:hypothetical protein [Oligoflexales bacterium]